MLRKVACIVGAILILAACGRNQSSASQSGFAAFPTGTQTSSSSSGSNVFDPNANQTPSNIPINTTDANNALGPNASNILSDIDSLSNAQVPSDVIAPAQDVLNSVAGIAKNDPAVAQKVADLSNQMNQAMKAMPAHPSQQQMQNLATYLQNLLKQFIQWLIQHLQSGG